MPRYKVVRDCYGFMERLWTEGTVVDISNPPEDLPRHFELVKLLPGEKEIPKRRTPAQGMSLDDLLRTAQKGILNNDQATELVNRVKALQAQAVTPPAPVMVSESYQSSSLGTPPADLLGDADEDDEVAGAAEHAGDPNTIQEGNMQIKITPPPPEVETVNVGGTQVVVKATAGKEKPAIPKIDASPKKAGPRISIQPK